MMESQHAAMGVIRWRVNFLGSQVGRGSRLGLRRRRGFRQRQVGDHEYDSGSDDHEKKCGAKNQAIDC